MEDLLVSSSKKTSNEKKKKLDSFKLLNSFSSSPSPSSSFSPSSSKLNSFFVKSALLLFIIFIFILALTQWFDVITLATNSRLFTYKRLFNNNYKYPKKDEYLLNCTTSNMTITCPSNYPHTSYNLSFNSNETCPEYFRWIHEDLKIWKDNGITREMVESLQEGAHFRLVIVNGIAYVKQFYKGYQTRDTYTFWGILQLLKLYPGGLPDLDLVFQCDDHPTVKKEDYKGIKSAFAPPQFHFCGNDSTYDIVFPDWSFWGWPEINIKPWVPLLKDYKSSPVKNWTSREPYAFWKGNMHNGPRRELRKCNSTNDWNTIIAKLDWGKETKDGFKNSDLSKQCNHRYKIYMEGFTWSVSEKYIIACDSMTILINPKYYEFFTRSLIPMVHYWPANPDNLCHSLKFAVDWGNKYTHKAEEIGKAGSKFIFDQIKMEHVYDYMFHLLNEYAKLLKYKPTVPEGSIELCSEKFACSPMGLEATYKKETMVNGPSERGPCKLPPPYDPHTLEAIIERNSKIRQVVEMWEKGSA